MNVIDLERLAAWEEHVRPLMVRLPPAMAVRLYSWGRPRFLAALAEHPPEPLAIPVGLEHRLWGIDFRSPVGNAAGMFKDGSGYELVASQGAGFYLAGTTTASPRSGNKSKVDHLDLHQPFAPYPSSGAASNWLGLPNPGDEPVAQRLADLDRVAGCPVGASLGADPELAGEERLAALIRGLEAYTAAGVDFLEINESCPNTGEEAAQEERELEELGQRLGRLRQGFLDRSERPPVVVKLSCDTDPAVVSELVDRLLDEGFDGVNFGNTSTAYDRRREAIAPPDRPIFDFFSDNFGGGVSGRPLKEDSLRLAAAAVEQRERRAPGREFHVVRTGGVEDAADVRRSLDAGISLVQWYTGYFQAFAAAGHELYLDLYDEIRAGA